MTPMSEVRAPRQAHESLLFKCELISLETPQPGALSHPFPMIIPSVERQTQCDCVRRGHRVRDGDVQEPKRIKRPDKKVEHRDFV